MYTDNLSLKTILLADDDSDDREFFHDALKDVSAEILLRTAENGIEALNLLRAGADFPDLIFLDLNMPLKNGHECLHDIKGDEMLKHIPVIIFSTSLQPETANNVYNGGASLYVVKPNSFAALKELLRKVLAMNWKISSRPLKEHFIFQG